MEQWQRCKQQAKDAVLFFRMGDFYEAFYEDARILAEELDLTLTKRQQVPMSGVPWHSSDSYIDKLVAKGYRVAIAEQTEDPQKAKGLVNRSIVRLITPGTLINSPSLEGKAHNYLAAVTQIGSIYALASCDITTATFQTIELESEAELINELFRLNAAEIVLSKKFHDKHPHIVNDLLKIPYFFLEEWHFDHETAYRYLTDHFHVAHLDSFGLKGAVAAINAAGALLAYMHEELCLPIDHIKKIQPYSTKEILQLDRICQLNLELTEPLYERGKGSTLLRIMDHTLTPMGGRLLREWIKKPLLSVEKIHKRQEAVACFLQQTELCFKLETELKSVRDLQRLMMRSASGFAGPRDLLNLALSLEKVPEIKALLSNLSSEQIKACAARLVDLSPLSLRLKQALVEEPPARLSEGNFIREGFYPPLDELHSIMQGGKKWLGDYQTALKQEYGIKNLKISFNKVFGYTIEVSKAQAHLMPDSFERRQTLVNCERFVSQKLKEYENRVLTAEERALAMEQELFQELRQSACTQEAAIFTTAESLAEIDLLLSLALLAKKRGYCRPLVDNSRTLKIEQGRHPVVEAIGDSARFIPNDTLFEGALERMMVITGPNMAGKSTYIRQVALIVIMAQMGSFVPARSAHIGLVDKIFTRIGAHDDLARGQSTFMVEMSETANILNNLTPRSLVILDEIGRGTSTYDGLAIAWAVAECLLGGEAKTLFATHYGELTELEKLFAGCSNYHAAAEEQDGEILFLHKIQKGAASQSYGIHVAKLAGLPLTVVRRAGSILKKLELRKKAASRPAASAPKKDGDELQLLLF